ncbi:hypothetical protein RRG08_033277 [Elysia crispata]|uniref:Uncharacterized protein n=1 Tax=Elysia crispata TaxID=231223 RepID=A0AAE0XRL4_9GAST|nr:hypothetical protein RRG08_033277 [Elysia crispata]
MDLSDAVKFQWEFDRNAKEKGKNLNNFKSTKSVSEGKLLPVKKTPVADIGTSFSPRARDQNAKLARSNRKKATLSLRSRDTDTDSSSHKPYASSSLWKPPDLGQGPGHRSKKTFLTLTPVMRSSTEGHGQPQSKPPGVPLISMTPPLRADISQHTAWVPDAKGECKEKAIPNSTSELPSPSSCIFCQAETSRERLQDDLASQTSSGQEHQDRQGQQNRCPPHDTALSTDHNDRPTPCSETDHISRPTPKDEFSKLSRLPDIKSWENYSEQTDSDTTNNSYFNRSSSPELDYFLQPISHGGTHFARNMWENPRLSRKDTLLDSISDRNLLDRKTLFSKRVDASYSRITHENTVILPPVECNRRQRDVPGDSTYLTEKKYVSEAFAKHSKNRQDGRNDKARRKGLEVHAQDLEHNRKRKFVNKLQKPGVHRKARNFNDPASERNQTFENERYIAGNPFFPSHRLSLDDSAHVAGSTAYPSQTDTSMLLLGRSQHPGNILATNGFAQNLAKSTITGSRNSIQHDKNSITYTRGQFSGLEPDRDDNPLRHTRFRLPAGHFSHHDTNRHREAHPLYTGNDTQLSLLASHASCFENPCHETTHFCDVLGKNSCSRCREQKERRSKANVTNYIGNSERKNVLVSLGRTGIVSPPPTPSPSPTFFLPVKALHKVVIKVKDKQGLTSMTSVGVNEDVVRRTTA